MAEKKLRSTRTSLPAPLSCICCEHQAVSPCSARPACSISVHADKHYLFRCVFSRQNRESLNVEWPSAIYACVIHSILFRGVTTIKKFVFPERIGVVRKTNMLTFWVFLQHTYNSVVKTCLKFPLALLPKIKYFVWVSVLQVCKC